MTDVSWLVYCPPQNPPLPVPHVNLVAQSRALGEVWAHLNKKTGTLLYVILWLCGLGAIDF